MERTDWLSDPGPGVGPAELAGDWSAAEGVDDALAERGGATLLASRWGRARSEATGTA